jgi:hypothetical protein
MNILETHSHLNGPEYLHVHEPRLWDDVREAVRDARAVASCSREMNARYAAHEIQAAIQSQLDRRRWLRHPPASRTDGTGAGYLKGRVRVKPRFGDPISSSLELHAGHMAFFVGDVIDVGVEFLPMKALQQDMSSGVAYYEGELYNLIREGRGVPAVPLVSVGVAP